MADHASARRGRRGQRGSTLLLFPASILVVMVLGAICVDFSKVHLARREAHAALSALADDAAAMLDRDAVRAGRFDAVDLDRARRFVATSWATHPAKLEGSLVGAITVDRGPRAGTVVLSATIRVDHLFGRVAPDSVASTTFTVDAVGELLA